MITTHRLPADTFAALARGYGGPEAVRYLRDAQHSKHLMLLHLLGLQTGRYPSVSPEIAAFTKALAVLAAVQGTAPAAFAWAIGLPHIGAWLHDCLEHEDRGAPPEFGHLASIAAAAAVGGGVPFELDVPVREGRVALPGLGSFEDISRGPWVRVRSDGERLSLGPSREVPCAAIRPDDGSAAPVPGWRGTPLARVTEGEREWSVLLETDDPHLDRFGRLVAGALSQGQAREWRSRLRSAGDLLARHHSWAAGPISAGVSVIVPLTVRSEADLDSATTPAAFGVVAASRPPDAVVLAEMLVHEFQHLKLCGLLDMVRLMRPCEELIYAPWRDDPRPASALLQGIYAHLGVARFWSSQRKAETDPDRIFRAEVLFERWRRTIEPCLATLLRTDCLTAEGVEFAAVLRGEGHRLASEPVPAAAQIAAENIALDHWLAWQLSHIGVSAAGLAGLATAYQRGESLAGRPLPETRVEEEARKVRPAVRSQALRERHLEPRRYRERGSAEMPGLSAADRYLLDGQAAPAIRAYRDEIMETAEPQPESWVGLALAARQLERASSPSAFADRLPLMFDLHAYLLAREVRCDPLELAAWFS